MPETLSEDCQRILTAIRELQLSGRKSTRRWAHKGEWRETMRFDPVPLRVLFADTDRIPRTNYRFDVEAALSELEIRGLIEHRPVDRVPRGEFIRPDGYQVEVDYSGLSKPIRAMRDRLAELRSDGVTDHVFEHVMETDPELYEAYLEAKVGPDAGMDVRVRGEGLRPAGISMGSSARLPVPGVRITKDGLEALGNEKSEPIGPPSEPPAFDEVNWVRSKRAAGIEGVDAGTLGTYRSKGYTSPDRTWGMDGYGRYWRKPTVHAQTWYLKSTLKESAVEKA